MQTEIVSTAKRADMFKVPASNLRIKEGLNIRSDYGNIQELADSIKENGVKVPLRGYKERENGYEVFVVVDGHRRHTALQLLLEQGTEIIVPFITENKGYNDEQRLIDMFLMNEGKSLTPLEQAEGVRRLIAYGYSEKEIALKLAKSEVYVRKLNSLNSAPKAFRKLIEEGTISATLAIETIAKGQVEDLMNTIEENKKTPVKAPENTNEQDTQSNDGKEIKDPTPARITKKDLKEQNSIKEFKKFMKNANEDLISESVLYVYQFAAKLANNELSFEEIKEFFK